jgi:hypothetical protein
MKHDNDERFKYVVPVATRLDDSLAVHGACTVGSGNIDSCAAGCGAPGGCTDGLASPSPPNPGDKGGCHTGNQVECPRHRP